MISGIIFAQKRRHPSLERNSILILYNYWICWRKCQFNGLRAPTFPQPWRKRYKKWMNGRLTCFHPIDSVMNHVLVFVFFVTTLAQTCNMNIPCSFNAPNELQWHPNPAQPQLPAKDFFPETTTWETSVFMSGFVYSFWIMSGIWLW